MTETNDIYGQDILLDEYLQPMVTATGEQLLTEGVQTVVQQIKLRLAIPIDEATETGMFYKSDFGSQLYNYFREEDTPDNRNAIIAETISTINKDSRVNPNQTYAYVSETTDGSIQIEVQFEILNEESPFNLVIQSDSDLGLLIKDRN